MKLIATIGPLKGLVLNLEDKDEWIIGRDPDQCNFILEDTTVSRKHAKIYKTVEGYVIKNLSITNPIEVNNNRVDEYLLEEDDKIKIGDTIFTFTSLEAKDVKEEPIEDIEEERYRVKEPTDETIFEETEEDLPIPMVIDAPFILKVISGANAGSEFGMDKVKSYIIGKDSSSCDLIFSDLSVSKQNTKITIDENGSIFVEDLKSKNGTYVNNKKIEEKTQITSQDLITVGTTAFLVIEKEGASETIYSPAPTFEKEEKEEKKELVKQSIWKKQFIPTRHLIFAGSFLVIFFIVFLSFFALFKSKDVEVVQIMPTDKIENITKNYDTVEFSFNPSSANLFLVGHVLTSIDKQELLYDLNQLGFIQKIEDNIIVDEYILKSFNDTLAEEETFRSVYISANRPGNFILEGYVVSPDTFTTLVDFVNQYFPYLDKLNNTVVIEKILQVQIATDLTKNGFGAITFELISGELVLAGRYSKKQASNYKKLLDQLLQTPGIHSIKNLAISSSADEARIDISSKYKITGWAKYDDTNFSVVANGKIVIPGDLLDTLLVTQITQNAILLEKDEIKYKISYSP